MEKKLLSILMVSHNHASYLKDAIDSVITQAYQNWELIIFDDGSTDNSLKMAQSYASRIPEKIKSYAHEGKKNLGIAVSYETGMRLCQGEYIAFLEPDDIWESDNVVTKIKFFENDEIGFVYSDVLAIGEPMVAAKRRLTLKSFSKVPAGIPFFAFPKLLVDNFVPSFSTVIARKKVFDNIRFISDKKCAIWLDWFFWIQISLCTKFLFVPQKLVRWRLYQNSYCNTFISRSGIRARISFELQYRFMIFKEIIIFGEGDPWQKSVLSCMFIWASIKKGFLFLYNRIRKISN